MDVGERPATLGGVEGVLTGTAEDGMVWRTELPADRVGTFLKSSVGGAALELRSEAGVCRADVRRCWVDVGERSLTLHVALDARPLA